MSEIFLYRTTAAALCVSLILACFFVGSVMDDKFSMRKLGLGFTVSGVSLLLAAIVHGFDATAPEYSYAPLVPLLLGFIMWHAEDRRAINQGRDRRKSGCA